MELRHLDQFVAVAEELSFTAAARRLHVVQSGVSASIRALERELGTPLFERTTQRVALTEAGHALLPEARRTLAGARAARDAVDAVRGGLRGSVTVGTMHMAGLIDVAGALGRFHRDHPEVTVRLRRDVAGSAGLAQGVLDGTLDLALLSVVGRPPAGLEVHRLIVEPLVVVCPAEHPLAGARGVALTRLADEPFVDFPPGFGNRSVVDRAFAAAGLERRVSFEVAEYAEAAALVAQRLGIAFLPAYAAAPLDGVAVVRTAGAALEWDVSVATAAVRPPGAAARALLAELEPAARLDSIL